MRRKFLSVVLCVCMMLTMAPFAFAEGSDDTTSSPATAVAQIGDTEYPSLQAAIDAAASRKTIQLVADTKENVTINKKLTLDLNGFTLNGGTEAGKPALTVNNASVTVQDTSEAQTGTIKREDTAENSAQGGAYYVIDIQGKNGFLKFLGGNVENDSGTEDCSRGTSLIRLGNDNARSANPTLTIENGTFTQNRFIAIKVDFGTLHFKGGTINCSDSYAIENWKSANIKGGTINGTVATWVYSTGIAASQLAISDGTVNGNVYAVNYDNAADKTAKVLITGGTITGELGLRSYNNGLVPIADESTALIDVTGGTFEKDPSKYLADGSIVKTNNDGKYEVEKTYLATVGGTGYYTWDEAYKAQTKSGEPIILQRNYTTNKITNSGSTNRTIDLNGHTWTYTGSDVNSAAFEINYSDVTLTVKNGTVVSNQLVGLIPSAMSGTITYDTSGLVFDSVTMTTTGSSGIESNGNNTNDTITLKNSTLNVPNGFGIYFPSSGSVTLENSKINAKTMGVQVCAGSLNVKNSEITVTGDPANKTESDGAIEDGAAISVVDRAGYKGLDKVTVESGKFAAKDNNSAVKAYKWNNSTKAEETFDNSANTIAISGGYFTSDPSAYCITGKTGVASDLSGYAYMVGTKSTSQNPATVNSATVKAEVSSTVPSDKRQDVTNAANSMAAGASATGSDLEAVVKSKSDTNTITGDQAIANNAVTKYNNSLSDGDKLTSGNVAIVYQSYIDVKVCDIEKATDSTTSNLSELTVELTPMYRVVATKQDNVNADTTLITEGESQNAVVIQEGKELDNVPVKNYEVKLALPTDFANAGDKLSIKHTKGNGSVEYYTGTVTTDENSNKFVTFTTNGFSPFVIYAASANVASIGDGANQKVYPTLQAAVDAVQNGETINVTGTDLSATVSGNKSFTVTGESVTLTAASGYNLTKNKNVYTVSRQHSGSSSSGTTTSYNVNVNAATNGAVAADKKTASKGTTVTVTASPSKGYVVDAVKVVDKDGKDVAVTGKDGKYVFTMPGSAVTVTGTFKAETPAPVALPFTDVKSGNWFYDAVKYAYEQGLMTGTSATTFAPNGTMNRAMIVTVLYRLEKSPAVTGASKFTDVPAGQWYSDAVAWAAANKIVNGYDETTFGPMNAVTREQMAAILFRYEQYKGLENVTLEENLNRFPDQNKISAYAIPALQWAVGQKIINGNADGTLDPTGTATRAQVAQIFTNLLNK